MTDSLLRLFLFFFALWPWNDPSVVDIDRNIVYDTGTPEATLLDLIVPAEATEPVPAIVIVHGGMWLFGSKKDYPILRRQLVGNGFACAAVDYEKSIELGYGGQVDDIKDSIRWLRAHAAEYNIDPERIGLFGSSAGGHLAALAGFSGNDEGFSVDAPGESSAVQAMYLLYGVYDLFGVIDNPLVRQMAGGLGPDEAPELYQLYSPIMHIDGSEPPVFLMHGTGDRVAPIEQAYALEALLEENNVLVTLEVIPDAMHGFYRTSPLSRPDVYESIAAFFVEQLDPQGPGS